MLGFADTTEHQEVRIPASTEEALLALVAAET